MRFKISINTHKPNTVLWLVALLFFVWGLFPVDYHDLGFVVSAVLLLAGTTLI
ncbi:MAG TPA: hypothetical protein VF478_04480 [Anaerolineae bacterium]